MINQSTGYNPTAYPGNATTVTIVSQPNSNPGLVGNNTDGFNSTTVCVGPNSFGPSYMVTPQQLSSARARQLLISGVALTVFGIIPLIAGAVIVTTVTYGGFGGVIPLIFGGVVSFIGVCLLIAACCMGCSTPVVPTTQASTVNQNVGPHQIAVPSAPVIHNQRSQPQPFGQNPPPYTEPYPQPPPPYQPVSGQCSWPNK